MDRHELFSKYVRHYFHYLVDRFSFVLSEDLYDQPAASSIVTFRSASREVRLIWDLKDEQFYFGIYRLPKNGEQIEYGDDDANHFNSSALARFNDSSLNLQLLYRLSPFEFDPRELEEKIKINAALLEKYGEDILLGRAWFDWRRETLIEEDRWSDA
jgi:hypothetical protein